MGDIKQQFLLFLLACTAYFMFSLLLPMATTKWVYEHFRSLCRNDIVVNINMICISKALLLPTGSGWEQRNKKKKERNKEANGNLYFNVMYFNVFHDMQIHNSRTVAEMVGTEKLHSTVNAHAKIFQHHLSPLVCVYAFSPTFASAVFIFERFGKNYQEKQLIWI